jgi:hypothetical protein
MEPEATEESIVDLGHEKRPGASGCPPLMANAAPGRCENPLERVSLVRELGAVRRTIGRR